MEGIPKETLVMYSELYEYFRKKDMGSMEAAQAAIGFVLYMCKFTDVSKQEWEMMMEEMKDLYDFYE